MEICYGTAARGAPPRRGTPAPGITQPRSKSAELPYIIGGISTFGRPPGEMELERRIDGIISVRCEFAEPPPTVMRKAEYLHVYKVTIVLLE